MDFNKINLQDLQLKHQLDVNPANGAVTANVEIPVTRGRNGFGPGLSLTYSSSSRNSAFGLGWSLSGISFISIDTKKGLPKYDGSDNFAFNGSTSLVPELAGAASQPRVHETSTHWIYHYRARIEESFTRFEQWVKKTDGATHWRTINIHNIVSIYGIRDGLIHRPGNRHHTFTWLLEEQYDNRGNAIIYKYKTENANNVDAGKSSEYERVRSATQTGFTQKYPERILYGNSTPLLPGQSIPATNKWLFEVVFDYGEYDNRPYENNTASRAWAARPDPFSIYNPGFEIRTYRLCRRILCYHNITALSPGSSLTGIFGMTYNENPLGTTIRSVTFTGVRRDLRTGTYSEKTLPPLSFSYTKPKPDNSFKPGVSASSVNVPQGFNSPNTRFVDLLGEGLPGILTETANNWYYKKNKGNGIFDSQETVISKPSQLIGDYSLGDFDNDGNLNLFSLQGRTAGFFEFDSRSNTWSGFRPFATIPQTANARLIDVNADGFTDILIENSDRITCYPFKGKEGFGEPFEFARPVSNGVEYAPTVGDNPLLDYFMADMTGDGLQDQVLIRNGRVAYYPNLGNGHFGEAVLMDNPPVFDHDNAFDSSRIRLYDLDGSGTADIIYLGRGEIKYWRNASGNSFAEGNIIGGLPYLDLLSSAVIIDFLGNGTPCLVWSNSLQYASASPVQYLEMASGEKPRLMKELNNGIGAITRIEYGYSGSHYLQSQNDGKNWISKIPSHFTVANKKTIIDTISNSSVAATYKYFDGHYDGNERSFVCFGRIEQYDVEIFDNASDTHSKDYTQPACTKTWLHPGLFGWEAEKTFQYYNEDAQQPLLPPPFFESGQAQSAEAFTTGYRALAGKLLRQEFFAVNAAGQLEEHPFSVTQKTYAIRKLQPGTARHEGSFHVYQSESLELLYDRMAGDPKIVHRLALHADDFGNITKEASIAYARRSSAAGIHSLQARDYITLASYDFLNTSTAAVNQAGVLFQSKLFEVNNIPRSANEILLWQDLKTAFDNWTTNALAFDETSPTGPTTVARLTAWHRSYFWNDALTGVLSLGQTGSVLLKHHEESACFNDELIDQAFNGKVTSAMLSGAAEGNYVLQDGYWWQRTPVKHYNPQAGFYSVDKLENQSGVFTNYRYDEHFLSIIEITDPLGNKTTAGMDYNIIQPCRLIDINDNVSEVLYDALGVPIVTTSQGTVMHNGAVELYGNDRIDNYTRLGDESFDNIISNPVKYLQNASTFLFYDLTGSSLRSIRLQRENLRFDGKGNTISTASVQLSVDYQDGLGRIIQTKRKVEPGPAVQRAPDGTIVTGTGGEPVLTHTTNRWLASGHVAYNNKQLPVRVFEPFFSGTHLLETDTALENYGVAIQQYYDAAGRMYRTDFPDATFSETTFTPWEVRSYDQNDTVDRSLYKILREVQPAGSPERMALDKSLAHKNTPTVMQLDPLGRTIVKTQINNNGTVRKTETVFDSNDSPVQVMDSRGLRAFEYKKDMVGRQLYEKSMDAGEKWIFYNSHDQPVHVWDSRGLHQVIRYDALDRVLTVQVAATPGANRISEKYVYGEDASVIQAKEKNLRGALVVHYDQAGKQELKLATPSDLPLHTERRLAAQFVNEPDWVNPASIALTADVFTSRYEYDLLDRLVLHQSPDQSTRKYVFNEGGGLKKVLLSTADGMLNDVEILKDSTYDAKGMRQMVVLGNGVEIAYTYDAETFRMKRLRSRRTNTAPRTYQDIHYTYDPVGNLVHLVDEAQQPAAASPRVLEGLSVSSHSEFEYDALYQLTAASGRVHQSLLQHDYADRSREAGVPADWGKGTRHITLNNGAAIERYTRSYGYDEAGNLQSIRHSGTSQNWVRQFWTSPNSNRSLPLLDMNGTAVSNPESRFDANGNCTYMPHLRSIDWNYRNNISKIVVIDRSAEGKPNDEEYYVYGADGMRVRKITQRLVDAANGTIELTEKIYLDGCDLKRITRGGTEVLKRFTSIIKDGENAIARVHAWEKDTQGRETGDISLKKIHYQLNDHRDAACMELDDQGNVITYEEYFPYGETSFIAGRNRREIELKEYRYSGKERDDFTGLYYFGYRYYAHWMGGWLSPDPLGPADDENLYLYVHNNPVNVVDPNGLQSSLPTRMLTPEDIRRVMHYRGSYEDNGGITEQYEYSSMHPNLDGTVTEVYGFARIHRNETGDIYGVEYEIGERTATDYYATRDIEGIPVIRRREPHSPPAPATVPRRRRSGTSRSGARRRCSTPPAPVTAEATPETVAPAPEREETPPPAEPEVPPPPETPEPEPEEPTAPDESEVPAETETDPWPPDSDSGEIYRPYGDNEHLNYAAGAGEAVLNIFGLSSEQVANDILDFERGDLVRRLEIIDSYNPFAHIRDTAAEAYDRGYHEMESEGTGMARTMGVMMAVDALNPFAHMRDAASEAYDQGYREMQSEGVGMARTMGVMMAIDTLNPFARIRDAGSETISAVERGDSYGAGRSANTALFQSAMILEGFRGVSIRTKRQLNLSQELPNDHHAIPVRRAGRGERRWIRQRGGRMLTTREWLAERGIDIDRYTYRITDGDHRALHRGLEPAERLVLERRLAATTNPTVRARLELDLQYRDWNQRWYDWINANRNATATEVMQFLDEMRTRHYPFLRDRPLIPYGHGR